jgi:Skp family chaperone for outer membrane proteins
MRFGHVVALSLALLAPCAAPAAAQRPPDPSAAAFVDLSQVLEQYRKTQAFAKYRQRLQEQSRAFNEELRTLAQLRYCTDAERQEAAAIKAKMKPTPAEQARLDELLKKADVIDNELAQLSQKTNPTDADTKRIQDLSRMRTEAAQNLAKEDADRRDRLRKLDQDMLGEVQTELLKLVEKVAKEQKVPVVYNRPAVLFGGTDLTAEVIKKLPK